MVTVGPYQTSYLMISSMFGTSTLTLELQTSVGVCDSWSGSSTGNARRAAYFRDIRASLECLAVWPDIKASLRVWPDIRASLECLT